MRAARLAGLALAVSSLAATSALAWEPETRIRMLDEAVRLMPESLRLALTSHREDLVRGALEPMTDEDGAEHRPPWDSGSVEVQIVESVGELVAAVEAASNFGDVARGFGRLAHFVADAGFPPGAAGGDGDRRYRHFSEFCESRREKFPLVFYGHDDPDLDRDDFRAFALRVLEEARAEDAELARAYAAAGEPPAAHAFDDRSVPFAVASLSYSRNVTHTVRAWLAAWRLSHGDLGRTPFLDPENRRQGRPR